MLQGRCHITNECGFDATIWLSNQLKGQLDAGARGVWGAQFNHLCTDPSFGWCWSDAPSCAGTNKCAFAVHAMSEAQFVTQRYYTVKEGARFRFAAGSPPCNEFYTRRAPSQ